MLDIYVKQFINVISHAVHISTPQTVSNIRLTSGFDRFFKAACVKANKARRHLKVETKQDPKRCGKKPAYVTYRKARARRKQLVQSTYGNIAESKSKKQNETYVTHARWYDWYDRYKTEPPYTKPSLHI